LREGGIAIGTWLFEFNTPGIARLLASAGIDFLVYDMEGVLVQTSGGWVSFMTWRRPVRLAILSLPRPLVRGPDHRFVCALVREL
jgi:hypothetical protein